ncbi:MAG: bifunctional phosphoglucose/phosphomannose isomerase [Bacteroidota bacterium]|jgi:glucose/mannose-6-phosphate isomerase
MEKLIQDFASQMRKAVEIGSKTKIRKPENDIRNVCLIGLGGSAFGGEVTKNYISAESTVPFEIVRDYTIPGYVSEHTLLIASSYSGNTEETLSALEAAMPRNPKIVCVTSGGKALEIALAQGFDHIVLPGGYPPRTAVGFSIIQQLFVLQSMGLIKDFKPALTEAIELVSKFDAHDEAKLLAEQLHKKIPVIYCSPAFESVAIRWRQQIEENSKHIAFHHVIPEMNHNELVGWKNPKELLEDTAVILLRSNLDHRRNAIRIDICRDLIGEYSDSVIEVPAEGKSHLAQLFYFLHLGDWVSYYLALLNKEDATLVNVIDFLKNELAKR